MRTTVLVIEDDASIRRGLVDALSFAGYGVLQCGAPLDTPIAGQIPTTAAPATPPAEAPPPAAA